MLVVSLRVVASEAVGWLSSKRLQERLFLHHLLALLLRVVAQKRVLYVLPVLLSPEF